VICKDFSHFNFVFVFFLMCKQTCKLGIHGIYDKRLFDKRHCRQTNA